MGSGKSHRVRGHRRGACLHSIQSRAQDDFRSAARPAIGSMSEILNHQWLGLDGHQLLRMALRLGLHHPPGLARLQLRSAPRMRVLIDRLGVSPVLKIPEAIAHLDNLLPSLRSPTSRSKRPACPARRPTRIHSPARTLFCSVYSRPSRRGQIPLRCLQFRNALMI